MVTKIKKIAGLVLFLSIFIFAGRASAIEYGMLGGKPANPDPNISDSASWFIYKLAPGEKKQDELLVMNLYEKRLDVLIYAADGTKSSGGGFALKQFAETKEEVGSWVKFYPEDVPAVFEGILNEKNGNIVEFCAISKEDLISSMKKVKISDNDFSARDKWCQGYDDVKLSLSSRENKKIKFVFSVPDKVDVGEHTGGILIQKAEPDDTGTEQQGSAVKLTTRVGVRIYETVPGQVIKKLTFSDFALVKNYKELDFMRWFEKNPKVEDFLVQGHITNSGNVSVDFQNVINIKDDLFGKRSQEIADRNFQVLKNDTFISNYSWESPRFGKYTFSMGLKYVDDNGLEQITNSNPITIWIFPWREIIAVIVFAIVFAGVYVGVRMYLKKKYGGIGWAPYVVKKTDTIAKISNKYVVDWQVLVRTNKLKPPYLLEAGMQILVPSLENSNETFVENIETSDEVVVEEKPKRRSNSRTKTKTAEKVVVEAVLTAPEKKPFDKKYLIWIGVALLLVGGIVAGVMLFLGKEKESTVVSELSIASIGGASQEAVQQGGEVTAPVEAEKEEVVVAKKETGSVSILNGGSVPGAAGKLSTFLKENGISDISAGNASADTHEGVVLYYQDEYEPFAKKVLESLTVKYKDAKIEIAKDDEQKTASVVIILGK